MRHVRLSGGLYEFSVRASMRITRFSNDTCAPSSVSISASTYTSSISGRFSIYDTSSANSAAGIIATAAFLPPLTFTLPRKAAVRREF